MSNALYRISVGGTPMPSDVNQVVDALSGASDVGAIALAPAIADPASAIGTATATSGTGLGVGTYLYAETFVTGIRKDNGDVVVSGETLPSPTKSVTTTSGNQNGSLSSIPNSADATVVAKRIYRTTVGGAQLKLVATIAAGATSYVDSLPDADLGANAPTINTTGTYIDGARIINVPAPVASGDATNKAYVDLHITKGTSHQSVSTHLALLQPIDARTVEYAYTNGLITSETIKDGATVVKTTTYTYTNGTITSYVEVVAGRTITTTINYNGDGTVSSVTRTVV